MSTLSAGTLRSRCTRATWREPATALLLFFALGLAGCQPPADLSLENPNKFPTRVAQGPDGKIYVSNTQLGSVFIYRFDDTTDELVPDQELKDLERPLGIAVDLKGRIFVGSDTRDCVEVFDRDGFKLRDIGLGEIQMPNDIAIAPNGEIFIADSLSDTVWVYLPNGTLVRSIGTSGSADGQFRFPSALAIARHSGVDELYVADQINARIQVFALDGTFLRSFGEKVSGRSNWQGRFVKIQSLAMDADERLHVLDSYMHVIQILNPTDGSFLDHYGSHGTNPGELNLPLDLCITTWGDTVVSNSGNETTEIITEEGSS